MRLILQCVEEQLPVMLRNPDVEWKSLLVDDEEPYVHRIWTKDGSTRIWLHVILRCSKGVEPLFHPHRAPSGMRIKRLVSLGHLSTYRMEYGVGKNGAPPERRFVRTFLEGDTYEMVDPDEWHSVSINAAEAWTVMVSGPLYPNVRPERTLRKPLGRLSSSRFQEVLHGFQKLYPLV